MWKIIKDLCLGITKSLVCRILELTGFVGSIIAFIKYQKEGINSAYSICKEQQEGLWRCFMNNIDSGTIWLIAAFLLMFSGFFFRWLRSKLSPISSDYYRQIKGVKLLYHYLEFFPYEQNPQDKRNFAQSFINNPDHPFGGGHNQIQESINLLVILIRNIYHEENLKNATIQFMNYFTPPRNNNGLINNGLIFPVFESNIEFLQKKKEVKKLSNIMIKYLENNRVN